MAKKFNLPEIYLKRRFISTESIERSSVERWPKAPGGSGVTRLSLRLQEVETKG